MKPDTIERLLALNRQFYQTFASQFASTRMRLQPGVQRILANLPSQTRILDLGCGNGELWRYLQSVGHQGLYVGLDFSAEFLEIATRAARSSTTEHAPAIFLQADLANDGWHTQLPEVNYDLVLAFATLHHLPSLQLRLQITRRVRKLLTEQGLFVHSEWQFLNSPRLTQRIQPWEKIDLSSQDVEPNDYLLDWRHGGYGYRYVHHFSESELQDLANQSGFHILETFLSDGDGGKLGLYQIWKTPDAVSAR